MREGYLFVPDAMSAPLLARLRQRFESTNAQRRGGMRNALDVEEVREAVEAMRPVAARLADEPVVRCVRGIVFDKTPEANWKVAWHQDRSIAVAAKAEREGFGPWSEKRGVVHVEPPPRILEKMITLRLHLDDCTDDTGPLRVIPSSHRYGVLSDDRISAARESAQVTLTCAAGDVIAMRPLLLHASSAAVLPGRRRVVHLEFSPDDLPAPLAWRWCV